MSSDLEAASRHRYRLEANGPTVPGVTTVIGETTPIRALPWSASEIGARTALDYFEDRHKFANDEDFIHWCRGQFDREWKAKAQRGTRVHDVAERWSRGETVDVTMEDSGFVDALENFHKDKKPVWIMAERVVVNHKGFGGKFDAIGSWDGLTVLVDWKSGGHYAYSVALQAAAYMDSELAVFDENGVLTRTEPLPPLDGARIIYLKEDGTYEIVDPFEHVSQDEAMIAFESCLELYEISQKINKKLKQGERND